ncbi:MAG UNVERIFIED_CONTAM: hypothetical protein LVQ98_06485 [Rickettsiaceae bacterium]|jgi:oligopeptidase A
MQNPLLNYDTELPDFKSIKPNHFEPAIDFLINSYNELIKDVVKIENPTWKNSIQVMDEASAKINFAFNIIDHLNNVQNTKEVREAYERTLPKIVNFSTDISQNKDLLIIYEKLSKSSEYQDYSIAQKKIIENAIKGFKLSGVDLPEDKKKIFKEINQKLSDLSNRFEKNTIDSTQSFSYHVEENKSDILKKLPKHTISLAEEKAKSLGKRGGF